MDVFLVPIDLQSPAAFVVRYYARGDLYIHPPFETEFLHRLGSCFDSHPRNRYTLAYNNILQRSL